MISLEILLDLGAKDVQVIGDSNLVLRQLIGEYKCKSLLLAPYFTVGIQFLVWNLNMCIGNQIERLMNLLK